MVMRVMDDVIGDAPLYSSALLSMVLRHEFSLLSITCNIVDSYYLQSPRGTLQTLRKKLVDLKVSQRLISPSRSWRHASCST